VAGVGDNLHTTSVVFGLVCLELCTMLWLWLLVANFCSATFCEDVTI
jgi:hypothetical protein